MKPINLILLRFTIVCLFLFIVGFFVIKYTWIESLFYAAVVSGVIIFVFTPRKPKSKKEDEDKELPK